MVFVFDKLPAHCFATLRSPVAGSARLGPVIREPFVPEAVFGLAVASTSMCRGQAICDLFDN